jgi:hypothetical protein
MRWRDRITGVVLGLILGIGIVTVFVFVYSERTVDAPSISNGHHARPSQSPNRSNGGKPSRPPIATVRIVAGAPPASGPAELGYGRGDLVRLRLISDSPVGVELLGYGIARTVPTGQPTLIQFKASKQGNFPLLVAGSHIDVARITIGPTL